MSESSTVTYRSLAVCSTKTDHSATGKFDGLPVELEAVDIFLGKLHQSGIRFDG
ncbi:hypothetical protein PtrSN002B_007652 [Pyrenophora tritici-repentis]|uniref:Uncharacterized protein n=1 Tax=Pyrenophora tritici-repentis TaxID=45151 RepID=A0A2W1E1F0_9PLEO|nr:hypothetical protein PtrV1_00998 [Pyrenophora tritici-repentis]KAF7453717.1 hypothetical protein A1F99_009750 [Pyrenophora tritici-repentis]KAF7576806.1 hypothetical protein PtrM4_010460 [Pyrenophora tritici-repentis]KAG9387477.1 hypothetical protein A1F94_000369 [Pyrenophora tritici-repentis]KAI0572692.1 hypothetical protein Alg215_09634 [Pyrenophora tritici-repentis]